MFEWEEEEEDALLILFWVVKVQLNIGFWETDKLTVSFMVKGASWNGAFKSTHPLDKRKKEKKKKHKHIQVS